MVTPFLVDVNGARQTINGLTASNSLYNIVATAWFTGYQDVNVAVVDVDNRVAESDKSNNTFSPPTLLLPTAIPACNGVTPTPTESSGGVVVAPSLDLQSRLLAMCGGLIFVIILIATLLRLFVQARKKE